ncbi:hypothetical protein G6F24_012762 [Rhizopus arrhizus]|nr:hypothetical protein G6F24_012762 [Rhizopus arrhizus]
MPDPALSPGSGRGCIQRGGGAWGDAPYQDLLAISDAAQARDDIDGQRSAAMGGSFGGYMANWIAGHTDRFRAIVSHASLWTLSQFGPTTDAYHYWRQEIGAQMLQHHSPHRFVRDIRTPMLIIHGDKDYPVPIGEALSLWAQLAEQFADEQGRMPHKFLYYPGENHWILARRTPRSGTRRCSPSSPNTSMAKPGNAPRRWDEAAAGTAGKRPAVDPLRRARRRSRAVRRRAGDPRRAARLGIVAAVGTGRAVCAGGLISQLSLQADLCNLVPATPDRIRFTVAAPGGGRNRHKARLAWLPVRIAWSAAQVVQGAAIPYQHLRIVVPLNDEAVLMHLRTALPVLLVLTAGLWLNQPVGPQRVSVLILRQGAVRGDLVKGQQLGERSNLHNAIRRGHQVLLVGQSCAELYINPPGGLCSWICSRSASEAPGALGHGGVEALQAETYDLHAEN